MNENKELKKTMLTLAGTGWFLICLGVACILETWHTYSGLHQLTIQDLAITKREAPNVVYDLFWSQTETYKLGFQIAAVVSFFSICFGVYILELRKKLLRLIREA